MIESLRTIGRHYKAGNLVWWLIAYLGVAHLLALYGALLVPSCHRGTLLFALALWPITGNAITAGAHRLWSHRSYKATFALRMYLMLTYSMANQRSLYHWVRDHRVHHKHSETDTDPHNATRGFFFAHIGWLLVKKHPSITTAGRELDFADLLDDWTVTFQKATDPYLAVFMCFILPGLACTLWGDDFWHGFYVAGALRYVAVMHFTWLVNSAAHLYGDRPYDPHINPAENPLVSLAALGEGWHNWHHKYPYDYATSEFGISKQFNPTKLFIDACCFLGLASDRKRATGAWAKAKLAREVEMYGGAGEAAQKQE